MREVIRRLRRIVDSDCTVLMRGESGTGKEVVARVLHRYGRRRHGPFVALNCAAVPAELLESELFGRARGAYTGATAESRGVFPAADGGTLLLDEIGAMPLALQAKLLRAVQDRTVRAIGDSTEIPFDARIIAASNQSLEAGVEQDTFRRDLLFRLDVVDVDLPPLRERDEDVLELARHFLAQHVNRNGTKPSSMTPEFVARLLSHDWPGNVRELQNCMDAAVALSRSDCLQSDVWSDHFQKDRPSGMASTVGPLENLERRHMARVLRAVNGNKTVAARILGIDRVTLYRKLLEIESGHRPGRRRTR
jgi:two-component system response regulator HydG